MHRRTLELAVMGKRTSLLLAIIAGVSLLSASACRAAATRTISTVQQPSGAEPAPPRALEIVGKLDGVNRLDQTASKTSTWARYAAATKDDDPDPPRSVLLKPETIVWVVAATGEIELLGNPVIRGTWAIIVLDSTTGIELARDVGQGPSWPAYFATL